MHIHFSSFCRYVLFLVQSLTALKNDGIGQGGNVGDKAGAAKKKDPYRKGILSSCLWIRGLHRGFVCKAVLVWLALCDTVKVGLLIYLITAQ